MAPAPGALFMSAEYAGEGCDIVEHYGFYPRL